MVTQFGYVKSLLGYRVSPQEREKLFQMLQDGQDQPLLVSARWVYKTIYILHEFRNNHKHAELFLTFLVTFFLKQHIPVTSYDLKNVN